MPTQVLMNVNEKANSWASENSLRILVVLESVLLLLCRTCSCFDLVFESFGGERCRLTET